jgi:hypothetical protein
MEQALQLKTKKTKKQIKEEKNIPLLKDYSQLYQKGWDVFTMLGESKAFNDLANQKNNLRNVIIKTLNDGNFNEENIYEKLFSNYHGLPFNTFAELVGVIEDTYTTGLEINNANVNEIINTFKPSIDKYLLKIADKQQKFTLRDTIALTSQKRIKQNNLSEQNLLTEEKIKKNRLQLANGAIPYYIEDEETGIKKEFYDFAAIKFLRYKDDLEFPIIDYYTNEILLKKEEKTFANYDKFLEDLKAQKYKFTTFEKAYPEANDILVTGKNIQIAKQKPTQTENAVYMMYKINKAKLNKKSLFLFDRSFKKAKKMFNSTTTRMEDKKYNPYKSFKKQKASFMEYKDTLNEAISMLSAINYARIYMEPSTFKKVEGHLELQASMQLAKIPNVNATWILPYVSEKVLELSKENFKVAGLTDLNEIKALYKNTGRDVDGLNSIDEIIFSKVNYSHVPKVKKANNKGVGETKDKELVEKNDVKNDEFFDNFNRTQPLYKMYKEQIKKAKEAEAKAKEAEAKAKETEAKAKAEAKAKEAEAKAEGPIKTKLADEAPVSELTLAKMKLKDFLENNIIIKNPNNFSVTPEIKANSDKIMEARKSGVDLNKVVDIFYNEIAKDMDENEDYYKTKEGKFYDLGTMTFKKYFLGPKGRLTPRTQFRKMLKETLKTLAKDNEQEQTV